MEQVNRTKQVRRDAWDEGLTELEILRRTAAKPGFFGRVAFVVKDGIVEAVHSENTKNLRRRKLAA